VCSGGTCVTATATCGGLAECSGACRDLNVDPSNCGGCGVACTGGKSCVGGVCTLVCGPGTSQCSARCVDTQIDGTNCGGCGTTCPATASCTGGSCLCPGAKPLICAGACKDGANDMQNCGACGNVCSIKCANGTCVNLTTVAMAAEASHVCAQMSDGTLRCWGYNSYGQVGDATTTNRAAPVSLSAFAGVTGVAVGASHTCAIVGGGVKCVGYNTYGQLGNGNTTTASAPVDVSGLPAGVAVTQLTAGASHTCALLADGSIWCWGYNSYSQLGNNTTTNSSVPVQVQGLAIKAVEIAAGYWFTCARLEDATVACWGYNTYGDLGMGDTTSRKVATIVPGVSNVAQIAAGNDNACVRLNDGTVACWGDNTYGSIGDGTTTGSKVAKGVAGLSNVAQIGVGYYHVCARLNDGTLSCWGYNNYGQMANGGTATGPKVPTAVTSISGVTQLFVGKYGNCALTAGGLKCWGDNTYYTTGDGLTTTTNRTSPVSVAF
jgi:alpha-tubulin suppressor-like RCC1 family protein